jgi:hypothetical protein
VQSISLSRQKTVLRNEVTSYPSQPTRLSRRPPHGMADRIPQEANAGGNAGDYADVRTVVWKVEVQVGVHML